MELGCTIHQSIDAKSQLLQLTLLRVPIIFKPLIEFCIQPLFAEQPKEPEGHADNGGRRNTKYSSYGEYVSYELKRVHDGHPIDGEA
jgi:hypothetical protein